MTLVIGPTQEGVSTPKKSAHADGTAWAQRETLQTPVVGRASFLLCKLDICLGELYIDLNRLQIFVAKDLLQFKDVAPVAQEIDGEGVAEAVGMDVGHFGLVCDADEEVAQVVALDEAIGVGGEERVLLFGVGTICQVAPDGVTSRFAQVDDTLFVTLGVFDEETPTLGIVVAQGEPTKFGGP